MMTNCPADHRAARPRGFTLIEVMIVVAIVAILTAIALPSYRDYIVRGKLVDGTNALANLRARLELYYQDNRTYLTLSKDIVSPCDSIPAAGTFSVTCTQATATAYFLTAQGSGVTQDFVYTTDTKDTQVTASLPTRWGTAAPYKCWITRKGDSC